VAAAYRFGPTVAPGGGAETVFDWSRMRCAPTHIPDLPPRAFRDARGRVQLVLSHDTSRRMLGTSLDLLRRDCRVIMSSGRSADPARFDDREWIAATYTRDGRTIYALVHNEYQGHTHRGRCPSGRYVACWYNSVTLAASRDEGGSYRNGVAPPLHRVASAPYRYAPDAGPYGVFAPSNIVYRARDGYYYAMVQVEPYRAQKGGTCVMRTRSLADPRSWRAWGGSLRGFAVRFIDPYREPREPAELHVCEPVSFAQIEKMHESVTYSTYLDKYVLVGLTGKWDAYRNRLVFGFYYSTSSDLVNWSERELLMEGVPTWRYRCGDPVLGQDPVEYPALLDPDSPSRNFETTDRRPYLYFTRISYRHCRQTLDRDLVRIPIEFKEPGCVIRVLCGSSGLASVGAPR
jgi:acetoacetate decarboxylase